MKKLVNYDHFKKIVLVLFDIANVILSGYLSYLLLDEPREINEQHLIVYTIILVAISIFIFFIWRLYKSLWRYAGLAEAVRIFLAATTILIINLTVAFITRDNNRSYMEISWCIVFSFVHLFFTLIIRFIYRIIRYCKNRSWLLLRKKGYIDSRTRVMIVGAGDAGLSIVHEIHNNSSMKMKTICFIDDDQRKKGNLIEGIKVVGGINEIPEAALKYEIDLIIIAMPSVNNKVISNIINISQETKCKIQTLPGLYQLVNRQANLSLLRDVNIEDLLGREPICVNLNDINNYINNKVVLVTGGGGSIGSELCRQIAKSNPEKLIIVDIYENNAYEIEQELKHDYPNLNLIVLIASVRDMSRLDDIFSVYRPNIVIHAAAHKHVPLMETSPNEAIKNNVFGTLNTAKVSCKYGVNKFILISTDKAVNPTNVMGATKRICEMIIQTMNNKSQTEFVAVRFGNVLGSNGSVIPLFKKQIQNGGPVTVTHKDITRFFMTIPEAVSLVLQAGSYAKGGEIFVLDMGEPVKIYDLAVNLIRLSGFTPEEDIKIICTGLRPGEKLYEEILMDEEGLSETPNKLIHIGKPIKLDEDELFKNLDLLYKSAYQETKDMKTIIQNIVSTYKPLN